MFNNVALISLPPMDLLRPPGALAILGAACEEYSIEYDVYDFNLWLHKNIDINVRTKINDNWNSIDPFDYSTHEFYQIFLLKLEEYVDLILAAKPDLIAISIFYDQCAHCAIELLRALNKRAERSSITIVIGGTGIRAKLAVYNNIDLCYALLNNNLIDHYIFGEGEITFRKVLNKDFNYPGINNLEPIQIADLDQFPFPSYQKINPKNYYYVYKPELIITGSRGCVRKCTYCDVAKYWPKFRYRRGEMVAAELYHYYKTLGITNFEFSDSLINGSLKHFKEMNLALINYQKHDPEFKITYKGQYICRPQQYTKEQDYIDMKQAGCDYIYVGVESFSDKVRHDTLKKFSNTDLDFHLEMCGKYNIQNSFLMLIGYPTETLQNHTENLEALRRYQKYAQAGIINLITFGATTYILEDTPLFHMKDSLNIVPEFNVNDEFEYANWVSLDNPNLTLVERIRRWVELVNLASELGYVMPRMQDAISRFVTLLEKTKNKKIIYKITSQ